MSFKKAFFNASFEAFLISKYIYLDIYLHLMRIILHKYCNQVKSMISELMLVFLRFTLLS